MLSRVFRMALAPAALVCLASLATAQTKVGIIDMREAVNGTAEVKKAVAALELRLKPKQTEAAKLNQELQDIQGKLQSLQGKLTQQGEAELVSQGQRKQRDLTRLQEDLNAELEREQQDVGNRALARMREIVKKMAEGQGLDVVVDTSNTIYFKPALTLTKAAVEAYDKAHPAK
ncbi:MAG: OmpH family outer membrane protein [Candidatus Solibacter usitatus]|nr:OmpH family outer membrane protein [Candidatus Solibacter usitatus]